MKINKIYIPIYTATILIVGILIGSKLNYTKSSVLSFNQSSPSQAKLNRLIDLINYEYVDSVNSDSIVDLAVSGILSHLDPHSTYIDNQNIEAVSDHMRGEFVGIGINFYPYKDSVAVIKPLEGGPSIKAGIKSGDRIFKANGEAVYGKSLSNGTVIEKLKGAKGSEVNLTVYRRSLDSIMEFTLKRDAIPIKSVDAAYMFNDTIGYVKINRFSESTHKEFTSVSSRLVSDELKALVLDLRGNPGGFLDVAEAVADEFLEKDQLIFFTKDKFNESDYRYATSGGLFEGIYVYVLIDESSASASEIIAGAIQDNDRGTIVGRRSFGKGLVQREMPLGDGSVIRLTVSRYFTPTGRSIQKPYKDGDKDYNEEFLDRYFNGELYSASHIEVNDSLKFETPKGKIVYGGGGIIPDIFVPLRFRMDNETLDYVYRSGYISYFIFEELDHYRSFYASFTKEDFVKDFEVNDAFLNRFKTYLGARLNSEINYFRDINDVKLVLKSVIAEQLFGSDLAVQIFNQNDVMLKKIITINP